MLRHNMQGQCTAALDSDPPTTLSLAQTGTSSSSLWSVDPRSESCGSHTCFFYHPAPSYPQPGLKEGLRTPQGHHSHTEHQQHEGRTVPGVLAPNPEPSAEKIVSKDRVSMSP